MFTNVLKRSVIIGAVLLLVPFIVGLFAFGALIALLSYAWEASRALDRFDGLIDVNCEAELEAHSYDEEMP